MKKVDKTRPRGDFISMQEMAALIERAEQERLLKKDYRIGVAILRNYLALDRVVKENAHTILGLVKMVFGHPAEKAEKVLKRIVPKESSPDQSATAEAEILHGKGHRLYAQALGTAHPVSASSRGPLG